VHVGFTQPMHLKIVRDPTNLANFQFSYKPDNRENYLAPFEVNPHVHGFTGLMEVGVSMASTEAYRYAEFYNVSIDDCPSTCGALYCGQLTTACGNKLNCSSTCAGGNVCHANECMTCPSMALSTAEQGYECGTKVQTCTNNRNQKMQVNRDIGTVPIPPTQLHFCTDHSWTCVGKSKWAYLADGMECGHVTDNCLNNVTLFACPKTNDVCEGHKCGCIPTTFDQSFNCGKMADGCGREVSFGDNGSETCPAAGSCVDNHCCTPKTQADFPDNYECGSVSNGCGGYIELGSGATPLFIGDVGRTRGGGWYEGKFGMEFKAKSDLSISEFARALPQGASGLQESVPVELWDKDAKTLVATRTVGPSSKVRSQYAWEKLDSAVRLTSGKHYYLVQKVWKNFKDPYSTEYSSRRRPKFQMNTQYAELKGRIYSGTRSFNRVTRTMQDYKGEFPSGSTMRNRGGNVVNFAVLENGGCGAGRMCHADHTCTEGEEPGLLQDAEQELTQEEHQMTNVNQEEDELEEDKMAMAAELEEERQTEAAEFAETQKATGA